MIRVLQSCVYDRPVVLTKSTYRVSNLQMQDTVARGMYHVMGWRLLFAVLVMMTRGATNTDASGVPCAELSRELRYPCRCELDSQEVDRPVILMDCDRVVFPGELPALPYGAPIVSFRQRWAGHQALPPQLFGDTALPLRAIDFSGNALRRLTERVLHTLRDSLLELRLADNLLGDTLNPIFASSEFHGLVHLQHLDLSGNRIRAVEEGLLKGCDHLQELRLDRNSLTAVPSASLNGPRSLRTLSLSKNRIGQIKSGAFKAQRSMEQLDISDNLISNIEGDGFQAMDILRVLKLSRNKLTRLNSDVFNGAHNIQHLELADNFITEFPSVALKAFVGLRYLNLSANVIHNVNNNDLEALVHLYQLDLSRNNIGNIAPGTFLGLKQLRLLDISVNSLRTIEDDAFEGLDNLETLSLKDNNILLIPASALGRLPQLGALRLDYNRIAALSGEILRSMAERVSSLVLARNVIRELPPATFEHFRQLQHLDLTGNLLSSLAADTFSGLEGTLRTLRAPQNKISALTGAPLALAALQLLDLSDNRLMELPRDTFALLPSLVHLNLSGNPLTTASALPSGLLHRMPLLETLDASRAGLRALPADLLAEAKNMRAVYMSGNVILELGDGTFVNMANLTVVDLSYNGMTSIKPRAFVNTMGIRVLKLNGNQLSSFKGEMFNTGTGLESIDLSENELGYLFPSAFRIHPRLQSVSLARNKLTFFPAELIAGLQYLEHVDLSGNALKTVDELDFARLPRLRVLDLAYNQIDSVSEMSFHNSTQLQLLNLAENMIDRLGERTFEGLVRLQLLNLEGNLLAELPDTIFERARLQMLENVNLARNQFEVAPLKALQRQYFFVSSVNLSRNKVQDIPADDSVMVNIKTLDLSFNPLSSESIANVLGEPKTVRELHLAGCNVTDVTRLETPFLRHLNLSYNNISTLADTAFERTSLLEMLDLSHNQLETMPTAWPMLSSLQTLNVSYNPISSISQTELAGLDSLRQLSMHDLHECTRIERNAFRAVPNLASLDAYGYPKLGYLDVQGLLQHVPSGLERLNIETKEPALSADQLKPALQPRLRELGVMGSRLKTISSGTLSGVKTANIIIRLRNTSLTHLPPALFFPVPRSSAVSLDLAGSTLATLTAQTLAALDDRKAGLHLLGLDSNPIVCDCSARALWRWLPQHPDVTVKCSAPERFVGKSLLDLEEHQLTCLNSMHEHQPLPPTDDPSEQLATLAVQPPLRSTTEAEIIWSVMAATDRTRPKVPSATVGTGNDDTLIIGIVGGVVAFIAVLIIVICVIRVRTGSDHVSSGSGMAGHAHYPGHHMGPAMMAGGPGSSCACSTKGGTGAAPAMYAAGYAATTLPHKMATAAVPRHAYSTMGRVPPYYQNAPQPYFVAAYPTADDKIYR